MQLRETAAGPSVCLSVSMCMWDVVLFRLQATSVCGVGGYMHFVLATCV